MPLKNASTLLGRVRASYDGKRWSAWPNGDKPTVSNSFDFTTATIEDPLSFGGVFSNNTQGVGGNVAPTNLSSLRIATASTTGIKIACGNAAGQPSGYDDSFAFVPGVSTGNMRVTATIYRASGYAPVDNHEVELILGCATTSGGNHRWIECLFSDSERSTVNLNGQPADFTPIPSGQDGTGPAGSLGRGPAEGDIFIAELYRSTNRVRWGLKVAGVDQWYVDVTSATYITGLGEGAGIATFRRTANGDSVATSLGFKNLLVEAF